VTRTVALIGDPVAHSVSPAMQRAAFAAAGLDWSYVPIRVGRDELDDAWPGLVADLAGLNVTIPLKEAVIPLLDRLQPAARAAVSVNTVMLGGIETVGDSTDGAGFLAALEHADPRPRRRAVILGTGGAARAVAAALRGVGSEVRVLGRNVGAGARLADDVAGACFEPWEGAAAPLTDALDGADVLVNATPIGTGDPATSPVPGSVRLEPSTTVFDLVYRPRRTALLDGAAACGCVIVGGIEMLVEQGARSFELWTGLRAPVGRMREAAYRALDRHEAR
jgi:shikimate dehydrogenase